MCRVAVMCYFNATEIYNDIITAIGLCTLYVDLVYVSFENKYSNFQNCIQVLGEYLNNPQIIVYLFELYNRIHFTATLQVFILVIYIYIP